MIKPDLSYYDVDRAALLEDKPIEKRLSCQFLDYEYDTDEKYLDHTNSYLARSFHSMFSFITRENSPTLVVKLDTNNSSCSLVENRIQLGTRLLAETRFSQQFKMDVCFSVMLHEMFHKRFTNFDLRTKFMDTPLDSNAYYGNPFVEERVKKLIPSSLFRDVLNILEDYRIEKLGLETFPGYVFYFDACREYALTLHSEKKVSKREPVALAVEYLMYKILLPELVPFFLNYIDQFYVEFPVNKFSQKALLELINSLDNYIADNTNLVYSDHLRDLFKAVGEICALFPKEYNKSLEKSLEGSGFKGKVAPYFFEPGDVSEMDGYEGKIEGIDRKVSTIIEQESKAKPTSLMSKQEAQMERKEKLEIQSDHSEHYNEITIIAPVPGQVDPAILNPAKAMSKNIARNLGFISARLNQFNQEFELTEGDLDEDELHAIQHSKNIFFTEEPKPGFEFDFSILIDMSGSMHGVKINNAKIAAIGCALAVQGHDFINLFVYGHTFGSSKGNCVELFEFFNVNRKAKNWKSIFTCQAMGSNADGYAIQKLGEIMLKDSKAKKKIMVVISDGQPSAPAYGGILAEEHVKSVVNGLEKRGFKIIQVCVDNILASPRMFNHFIPYDQKGNFILKIKELLQNELRTYAEKT